MDNIDIVRRHEVQQPLLILDSDRVCVAVCCSVLQCVAVCCSVLQCVVVCYTECCSIFTQKRSIVERC